MAYKMTAPHSRVLLDYCRPHWNKSSEVARLANLVMADPATELLNVSKIIAALPPAEGLEDTITTLEEMVVLLRMVKRSVQRLVTEI